MKNYSRNHLADFVLQMPVIRGFGPVAQCERRPSCPIIIQMNLIEWSQTIQQPSTYFSCRDPPTPA